MMDVLMLIGCVTEKVIAETVQMSCTVYARSILSHVALSVLTRLLFAMVTVTAMMARMRRLALGIALTATTSE